MPIVVKNRTCELRSRCLARQMTRPFGMNPIVSANSLKASEAVDSWQIRRGLLVRDRLYHLKFELDELELLVGRRCACVFDDHDPKVVEAIERLAEYPKPPMTPVACELHLDRILHLGIDGLRASLRGRAENEEDECGQTIRSFGYALDGLSVMIENAAKMVAGMAADQPEVRHHELQDIFRSCWHIAHEPVETFRDVLQLFLFIYAAEVVAEEVCWPSPGALDRVLLPYYQRDCKAGVLDRESALELLGCFFVLLNEELPAGIQPSVMLGGADPMHCDVANEVSFLCLEAVRRTGLPAPNVVLRWTPGTPPELTQAVLDAASAGDASTMIVNDSCAIAGLSALGLSPEERTSYTICSTGAVVPSGACDPVAGVLRVQLCQCLLDEIFERVVYSGEVESFEQLQEFLEIRLGSMLATAFEERERRHALRREHGRRPLQSMFTKNCVQCTRDIDDGGVAHQWVPCEFSGFANFANSLVVIAHEVYDDGSSLTLPELKSILDSDFEGFETERERFSKVHPRYGHGRPEADAMAARVVGMIVRVCRSFNLENEGVCVVPGLLDSGAGLESGADLGATPDGRLAGEPVSSGCRPADSESSALLPMVCSCTSFDHAELPCGTVLHIDASRHDPAELGRALDLFVEQGGVVLRLFA